MYKCPKCGGENDIHVSCTVILRIDQSNPMNIITVMHRKEDTEQNLAYADKDSNSEAMCWICDYEGTLQDFKQW